MDNAKLLNFIQNRKVDFIESFESTYHTHVYNRVDVSRYYHITPAVQLTGAAKITKDSRYTHPYRTCVYLTTGISLQNCMYTLMASNSLADQIANHFSDVYKHPTYSEDVEFNKIKTKERARARHRRCVDSFAFFENSELRNHDLDYVALVGKDALLGNEVKLGIFDSNIESNSSRFSTVVTNSYHIGQSKYSGNMIGNSLNELLFPHNTLNHSSSKFPDIATLWHYNVTVNRIRETIKAYNVKVEKGNYGIKELSRLIHKAALRISHLFTTEGKTPEEFDKNLDWLEVVPNLESKRIALPPSYFLESLPTHRALRKAIIGTVSSKIRMYNEDEEELNSKNFVPTWADLYPLRAYNSLNPLFRLDNNTELTFLARNFERKDEREDTRYNLFTTGQSLNIVSQCTYFLAKMHMMKLAMLASSIYYTVRMPELREEIKAYSKDVSLVANELLYLRLRFMLSSLDSSNMPPLMNAIMLLKYTESSKEYKEFIECYSALLACLACVEARITKIHMLQEVQHGISETLDFIYMGDKAKDIRALPSMYKGVVTATTNKHALSTHYKTIWEKCVNAAITKRDKKRKGGVT